MKFNYYKPDRRRSSVSIADHVADAWLKVFMDDNLSEQEKAACRSLPDRVQEVTDTYHQYTPYGENPQRVVTLTSYVEAALLNDILGVLFNAQGREYQPGLFLFHY